jgi:polar amino acid transport system substrate-binding protein
MDIPNAEVLTMWKQLGKQVMVAGGCALALCAAQAQCTRMVVAADPAYPPLHWYDGEQLQGASIEITKRVLGDLGIPYEIRFSGPFPRVVALAERGDIDMIATLKKTPEREAFLLYPKTAALSNPVAVFGVREHPFNFKDRADLVGLRGGITRGNLFGNGLDEYIRDKLTVEDSNNPESNFEKLALGRIDYFITGYYTGMALLLKRGDEMRFDAKEPFLADTANYLALTRRGQCADKLEQIDARLALLKKNGVLEDLIRKSFLRWKERPRMVDK